MERQSRSLSWCEEQTTAIIFGGTCRNRQERMAVHIAHSTGFLEPVCGVVLHDAKRVNPQITDIKCPTNLNGFQIGLGQLGQGNFNLK